MKIENISVEQIKQGKNWKITNPAEFLSLELNELAIEDCESFSLDDYVVYSSIFVSDEGAVKPLVMIKGVGSFEYSGDICEFVQNRWQRVGLNPDPAALTFGREFIANPLKNDPSFDTGDENDDEREYNQIEFKKWAARL